MAKPKPLVRFRYRKGKKPKPKSAGAEASNAISPPPALAPEVTSEPEVLIQVETKKVVPPPVTVKVNRLGRLTLEIIAAANSHIEKTTDNLFVLGPEEEEERKVEYHKTPGTRLW